MVMRQYVAALGIAFLLGSASLAFAAPQTQTDMKQSLEQQGYSQVHNWKNMGEVTSVQAMKDGQNWHLVLSPEGQIVRRESIKGGSIPGTP
jgi:Peptidase propeptide and YPEB domain